MYDTPVDVALSEPTSGASNPTYDAPRAVLMDRVALRSCHEAQRRARSGFRTGSGAVQPPRLRLVRTNSGSIRAIMRISISLARAKLYILRPPRFGGLALLTKPRDTAAESLVSKPISWSSALMASLGS